MQGGNVEQENEKERKRTNATRKNTVIDRGKENKRSRKEERT
jgi:hypothetical protein